MAKKYILNKTNSVLLLQDSKLITVVKLRPKQCSFQAFDEMELLSSPYIYKTYRNGYIDLLDERVEVVTKSNAQDYGQKYKIGTRAYLNDKNNLDIEVLSYNPNTKIYTVKILRTGGKVTAVEKSISLKKNIGDRINVDIDENGDLTDVQDISGHRDLSLPQEPDQVQVVHTQDQTVNMAKNANQVIADQARRADEIASQQAEVVYKNEEVERPEDDEETFIVKAKDGKFAKEISSSEMIENTQKAINESLQQVVDSTVVCKPEEKKDDFNVDAFMQLTPSLQEYIKAFMAKDARQKKMVISRLKDVEKLNAIISCTDELSVKAAQAKLAKLG